MTGQELYNMLQAAGTGVQKLDICRAKLKPKATVAEAVSVLVAEGYRPSAEKAVKMLGEQTPPIVVKLPSSAVVEEHPDERVESLTKENKQLNATCKMLSDERDALKARVAELEKAPKKG